MSTPEIDAAQEALAQAQAAVLDAREVLKKAIGGQPGIERLAQKLFAFITVTTEPAETPQDVTFHTKLINDEIEQAHCWESLLIEDERDNFRTMAAYCLKIAREEDQTSLVRRVLRFMQLAEGSDHIFASEREYISSDVTFTDEEWNLLEHLSAAGWSQ